MSDPIQTLEEFLTVAGAGAFSRSLQKKWQSIEDTPCIEIQYRAVLIEDTSPVSEIATQKQTSFSKQTSEKQIDPAWQNALADLKIQIPQRIYDMFLADTTLVAIEDAVAVISTERNYAKDFIEYQLANKINML